MALTMSDKEPARKDRSDWPAGLQEEFAREARSPNGCVGSELVSETDKVRVWTIRLKPGQRFGFHRHVLNYFWTAITPCRGRQHLMDGTTVEYTYASGETRHESYGPGEFKVHDLEKHRRRRHGVHDGRVSGKRQRAAGDPGGDQARGVRGAFFDLLDINHGVIALPRLDRGIDRAIQ